MPRITLRNHKVHFQQIGNGPDILLLHGLSCHIAFWWFHVAPRLAETHRVTALDLRGHGFTGMTESGYRPCDLAKDVEALLDHLGIARTHLLAHSFGGAVAAALATERPDLVSGVTLADAWLPSLQPVPPLLSGRDWTATVRRAEARGMAVEPNLPLVVRGLFKEMLDEHEFQADAGADRGEMQGETTWEDAVRPRARGGLSGFGWGGTQLGRVLWSPLRPRSARQAGGPGSAKHPAANNAAAAGTADPSGRDKQGEPPVLQGAMMMTGKPGEPSLALRRWKELMRWTNARAEYLDTTGIDPEALRDISVPVRLVYGARSLYRPSAVKFRELVPQATLRIVPRAGHYFPLLRPQALVDAMVETQAQDTNSQRDQPHDGPDTSKETAQHLRLIVSGDAEPAEPAARDRAALPRTKTGAPGA